LEASTSRPAIARSYWDAFGMGVILAVALIVLGSLWSLVTNFRARRVEPGEA
jgi:Na+-translocating ferredoxin:NAD+ oxidoreductase RnfE subunit